MHLFKSKHQKLILQCYPAGKNTDKKPNALELSYLLYYATTRRIKLEKVGAYLEKKTLHDIARGHTGNAQVSLEIFSRLIEKCADNLSVFAENVMVVLQAATAASDVALCQEAVRVFRRLCLNLDEDMLTGDVVFVRTFDLLSRSFLSRGEEAGPQYQKWQAIGVDLADALARSPFVTKRYAQPTVDVAMTLLLDTPEAQAIAPLVPDSGVTRIETRRLSRVAVERLPALAALQAFFDSTSLMQLQMGTQAVCQYFTSHNHPQAWNDAVMLTITSWAPVQLRFVVLGRLLGVLEKGKSPVVAATMAGLLASGVSMMGLAVTDTLRRVMAIQQTADLPVLSLIVSALASHSYYPNQTTDMLAGVLLHFKDALGVEPVVVRNAVCIIQAATPQNPCLLEAFSDTLGRVGAWSEPLQVSYLGLLQRFLKDAKGPDETRADYAGYITKPHSPMMAVFSALSEVVPAASLRMLSVVKDTMILALERYGVNAVASGIPLFFECQGDHLLAGRAVGADSLAYTFLLHAARLLRLDALERDVLAKIGQRVRGGVWVGAAVKGSLDSTDSFTYTPETLEPYFQSQLWVDVHRVPHGNGPPGLHDFLSNASFAAPDTSYTQSSNRSDPDQRSMRSHASLFLSARRTTPRVADLRRAASGAFSPNSASLPSRAQSLRPSVASIQTKELVSLLDELDVAVDVPGVRGRIAF